MQKSDLIDIIETYPSILSAFKGVFSINTVPKRLKSCSFIIVNTECDSEPGKHWFCLFKKSPKKFEYFDSLGVNKQKLNELKNRQIFPNNSSIQYNETQFQHSQSSSCGLFVLYFIIQRMHNLDLSFLTFLEESFTIDCVKNEEIISKFFKENF